MAWTAVILAAGKGTRMNSCKPKALQTLAGRTLVEHIIVKLADVAIDDVVIIHSPDAKKEFKEMLPYKFIEVYDGKKWNLRDRDETVDDLIDKNEFILEQKLEEWIENGKEYPIIMKKFNRYLEKKEKNQVINKIKEEIKLILFNNRKIIDITN